MNITKESLNDLHVQVNINIAPDDYLPKVEEAIKIYSKKLNMPGFRKGHVPLGMAKKMVGNEMLAEELNKLIGETLDNYIKEEKLNILGQPLPVEDEKKQQINIQSPTSYDFRFELGLVSDFELPDLSAKEFLNYEVKPDDKTVLDEVEKLKVRYGTTEETDTIVNDSVLSIIFKELNSDSSEKASGIEKTRRISIESFRNEEIKNQIKALKKGESLVIDLFKAYDNQDELIIHNILDISHDQAHDMSNTFKVTIDGIFEVKKTELNQDLYNRLFGEGIVNNEVELHEKIKEELSKSYTDASHQKLLNEISTYLIDNTKISFPENFLKKWILSYNEKPVTPEQVENEFGQFTRQLKWDLITERVSKEKGIKIEGAELKSFAMQRLREHYFAGQVNEMVEQYLSQMADKMMTDEKSRRNYFNMLMEEKLFAELKKKANIQPREISYDEFIHLEGQHNHHHH